MSDGKFDNWLVRWNLAQDGEAIMTGQSSSLLLPVLRDGTRAILKIAVDEEEIRGGDVMDWYAGDGAAKVLAHEGPALLLERLSGPRDLTTMARSGHDDEATEIICAVVARLHAPKERAPPKSSFRREYGFASLIQPRIGTAAF